MACKTVIIKGTQVYDSGQGKFVDISVLDVLQIFGRAGRPGMETSGEGYICTDIDKIDHYLDAVTAQVRTRVHSRNEYLLSLSSIQSSLSEFTNNLVRIFR